MLETNLQNQGKQSETAPLTEKANSLEVVKPSLEKEDNSKIHKCLVARAVVVFLKTVEKEGNSKTLTKINVDPRGMTTLML